MPNDIDRETTKTLRKEAALEFLKLAAVGRAGEAFARYVALGFRHHNPYFPGDAESLMSAMDQSAAAMPHKELQVKRVLCDGDFVAVHSRMRPEANHSGVAVVHLFRFDGERIAELWDIGQPVPEISPNEHGMF